MKLTDKILQPVHPSQFKEWRDHPVTLHLFNDLEKTFLDCATDSLPYDSMEKIAIEAVRRDAWRDLIDLILEWSPAGVTQEDEDDGE